MKYPVYEATYRAGRVVAIRVLKEPMTFDEFMDKYEVKERYRVETGYKILAQTVLDDEAVEIGATDLSTGFDDKYSIAVNVQSLKSSGNGPQNGLDTMNGSVFLAIPVESAADAKWISLQCAMSDSFKPIGTLESITCANAEGDPVTVDTTCSAALANGAKRGAQYQIYQCQWASFSCNIDAYISASNSAHEIISEHPDDEWLAENGYFGLIGYNDIGEVAGVYEWEDSGSKYIIAELGIGPNGSGSISESTTLYIDNVAVGGPNAFREAVLSMSDAGNILVIKTAPGMAMAAAAALDDIRDLGIVGCIAGDNTIFCATRSAAACLVVMNKLKELLES